MWRERGKPTFGPTFDLFREFPRNLLLSYFSATFILGGISGLVARQVTIFGDVSDLFGDLLRTFGTLARRPRETFLRLVGFGPRVSLSQVHGTSISHAFNCRGLRGSLRKTKMMMGAGIITQLIPQQLPCGSYGLRN